MPALSIVVPTYNRWGQLTAVLDGLAAQTVPAEEFEVVVVSDGSSDGTDDHLRAGRSKRPVVFVSQENNGPAAARNTGAAVASGELILFIDDDVVAEPECVAAHLSAHERANESTVVIGPLLTPERLPLTPWVAWEQRMLYKQYDAMARGDWAPTARQFYTGNASLEREVFARSGGFNPAFRRGEDVELAYRLHTAGVAFAFAFDARAFHHAERTYRSWQSNASAYGRNDVMMWRDGNQDWLLPTVRAEFGRRNPLTKAYTTAGLRFPSLGRLGDRLAERVVLSSERIGLSSVGQRVLSAVYNLSYYQGLVDELGGREALRAIAPSEVAGLDMFKGAALD